MTKQIKINDRIQFYWPNLSDKDLSFFVTEIIPRLRPHAESLVDFLASEGEREVYRRASLGNETNIPDASFSPNMFSSFSHKQLGDAVIAVSCLTYSEYSAALGDLWDSLAKTLVEHVTGRLDSLAARNEELEAIIAGLEVPLGN